MNSAALDRSTKIKLLNQETPLEFLPRLTEYLGGPKIYVKRDDAIGRGGGGNKLRKYERIIGDAIEKQCDTLIIAGHFQSNAARLLAGAACQFGLDSVIVCKELIPSRNQGFSKNGNALLMNLMGAKIVPIDKDADYMQEMEKVAENLKTTGKRPYIIPFGGSNVLGALGYADCAKEIISQSKEPEHAAPEYVFVTTGSGGTQAGLVAGFLEMKAKTQVIGISVLHPQETARKTVSDLAVQTAAFSGLESSGIPEILVDDGFIGKGYGIPTTEGIKAIKLLARLEAIFLCPVYTSKAMAGLIHYVKSGKVEKDSRIVFIHTGGLPLLFAYFEEMFANQLNTYEVYK